MSQNEKTPLTVEPKKEPWLDFAIRTWVELCLIPSEEKEKARILNEQAISHPNPRFRVCRKW